MLQRLAQLEGRVTVTHLQAAAPGREGADAVLATITPLTRVFGLDADAVKADEVALADEDGGLFRSILLTLALLVIVAAAFATIGLLVALGEERARELAQLRVAGMRRRAAGRLLIAESTVYGIVGAALGALAGVPFGNALATAIADHFAELNAGRGREQVDLVLGADPALIVTGAVIVAVVAGLAGRSASRLRPRRRPRRPPARRAHPPAHHPARQHAAPPSMLAAGAFLLGMGATSGGALIFIGLTVLLGAWWLHARRRAGAEDRDRTDQRAAVIGLGVVAGRRGGPGGLLAGRAGRLRGAHGRRHHRDPLRHRAGVRPAASRDAVRALLRPGRGAAGGAAHRRGLRGGGAAPQRDHARDGRVRALHGRGAGRARHRAGDRRAAAVRAAST